MHELAITQNIVEIATQHANGARVRRLTLEIGQLTAVMADSVRFCFDVCAQGTPLEGASLEIIEPPGIGQCRLCSNQLELDQPFGICDCGSMQIDIVQGEELTIKELETEALCV
jgi:hydrogenase nickel incorporation protein HypA/HybF